MQSNTKTFLEEYYALCLKHGLRLNAALQVQTITNSASVAAVLQIVELEVPKQKQEQDDETEQSGR